MSELTENNHKNNMNMGEETESKDEGELHVISNKTESLKIANYIMDSLISNSLYLLKSCSLNKSVKIKEVQNFDWNNKSDKTALNPNNNDNTSLEDAFAECNKSAATQSSFSVLPLCDLARKVLLENKITICGTMSSQEINEEKDTLTTIVKEFNCEQPTLQKADDTKDVLSSKSQCLPKPLKVVKEGKAKKVKSNASLAKEIKSISDTQKKNVLSLKKRKLLGIKAMQRLKVKKLAIKKQTNKKANITQRGIVNSNRVSQRRVVGVRNSNKTEISLSTESKITPVGILMEGNKLTEVNSFSKEETGQTATKEKLGKANKIALKPPKKQLTVSIAAKTNSQLNRKINFKRILPKQTTGTLKSIGKVENFNNVKLPVGKLPGTKKKNSKLYHKQKPPKSYLKPAPICKVFIDTNFGEQTVESFINENENHFSDDNEFSEEVPSQVRTYKKRKLNRFAREYDNHKQNGQNRNVKHSSRISRRQHLRKPHDCIVAIERMPKIDSLLPKRDSTLNLDPNICELCEPKRCFLSARVLASHINEEHISNSFRTVVSVCSPNLPTKKDESSSRGRSFCKDLQDVKLQNSMDNSVKLVDKDVPQFGKHITVSKICSKGSRNESTPLNYNCGICNRKFLTSGGLSSHKKIHTKRKAQHLASVQDQFKFFCNICKKSFQFCSDLVEHISLHSLSPQREQEILSSNMNKVRNVEINLLVGVEAQTSSEDDDRDSVWSDTSSEKGDEMSNSSEPESNPYKCDECGRLFTIKSVFQRHINFLSKGSKLEDPIKCPICNLEIKFRCELGAHLESHEPPPKEELICSRCNQIFRCENNLIRHELEHEGKLAINCPDCNDSFPSMSALHLHQKDCKLKSREYKCNVCKRAFSAKWRLDLHLKMDKKRGLHPPESKTYFCDQCGKEFKHLNVLKRHIDSKCGTEPMFECHECKKKYFSRGALASHKRMQHSTEKNFMCQYCSKDFFTKHQLHRHELHHKAIGGPYRCKFPKCEKTYKQPDSLRAHECEHSGFYPYICEFCGLEFSKIKSLQLHRKSSNHWSESEPNNKVLTQACRQSKRSTSNKKLSPEDITENETTTEGMKSEQTNLISHSQSEKISISDKNDPRQCPQYSTLQSFSVNHLIQQNQQQPTVLIQSSHLTNYSQPIENYFLITTPESQNTNHHFHSIMS